MRILLVAANGSLQCIYTHAYASAIAPMPVVQKTGTIFRQTDRRCEYPSGRFSTTGNVTCASALSAQLSEQTFTSHTHTRHAVRHFRDEKSQAIHYLPARSHAEALTGIYQTKIYLRRITTLKNKNKNKQN